MHALRDVCRLGASFASLAEAIALITLAVLGISQQRLQLVG
jgi:hypothetical protein